MARPTSLKILKNSYDEEFKMAPVVEKITECLVLGEGPHWDDTQQCLFFVSILENSIHKYVPSTGRHTKTTVDGRVGFIIPVEGKTDHFVVGVERKFQIIKWDGQEGTKADVVQELAEVEKEVGTTRINDGKCDPKGRLFGGTMGHENPPGEFEKDKGGLYSLEGNKICKKLIHGVGLSNGLAWNVKENAFYYIDSLKHVVTRYDYDINTGDIKNPKPIFDLKATGIDGFLDGMTIDTDGNLWIAVFNHSSVIKVDPSSGKIIQTVPIPALQVTSVTFGGPKYDILFVTSASMKIKAEQLPPCGATFQITGLGVRGHPNVSFKLE